MKRFTGVRGVSVEHLESGGLGCTFPCNMQHGAAGPAGTSLRVEVGAGLSRAEELHPKPKHCRGQLRGEGARGRHVVGIAAASCSLGQAEGSGLSLFQLPARRLYSYIIKVTSPQM